MAIKWVAEKQKDPENRVFVSYFSKRLLLQYRDVGNFEEEVAQAG